MGEDSQKLVLFSLDFSLPFVFPDFMLYPFTVINHSCEYDYMLLPMSLAHILPNLQWSWGLLTQLGSNNEIK